MKIIFLLFIVILISISLFSSKWLRSDSDLLIPREGIPFWMVGFTMAAGQFGSSSLIGGVQLASGYPIGEGFYAGAYALIAGALSCFVNIFIGPMIKLRAGGAVTPSDYLYRRYGRFALIQGIHSTVYILSMTCVLVSQFIGFASMASAIGFRYGAGILLCAVTVCLLAFGSGLLGVTVTDTIQYAFIVVLLPVTAYFSLTKLGQAGITTEQLFSESFFPAKAQFDKFHYILWPYIFNNMFNYEYFMRYQSCRSVKEARKACAVAGALLLVIALPVALLGAVANYCYNGCDTGTVFQKILFHDLPPVCRYALIIVVLMAILTTADSFLASVSAIASKDVYGNLIHRGKSIDELPHTRRIARGVMVLVCAAASVLALEFREILTIQFIFTPLTSGVFWAPVIIGIFWKGASRRGMICAVLIAVTAAVLHMTGVITLFDRLVGVIAVSVVSLVFFSLLLPDRENVRQRGS